MFDFCLLEEMEEASFLIHRNWILQKDLEKKKINEQQFFHIWNANSPNKAFIFSETWVREPEWVTLCNLFSPILWTELDPTKFIHSSFTPVPQNVTAFGRKVLKGVINLLLNYYLKLFIYYKINSLVWALIQYDWVLTKNKN